MNFGNRPRRTSAQIDVVGGGGNEQYISLGPFDDGEVVEKLYFDVTDSAPSGTVYFYFQVAVFQFEAASDGSDFDAGQLIMWNPDTVNRQLWFEVDSGKYQRVYPVNWRVGWPKDHRWLTLKINAQSAGGSFYGIFSADVKRFGP